MCSSHIKLRLNFHKNSSCESLLFIFRKFYVASTRFWWVISDDIRWSYNNIALYRCVWTICAWMIWIWYVIAVECYLANNWNNWISRVSRFRKWWCRSVITDLNMRFMNETRDNSDFEWHNTSNLKNIPAKSKPEEHFSFFKNTHNKT